MSDIVERLRAWVYTDSLYTTAREAADEIERLRGLLSRTGSNSRQTGDEAAECRQQSENLPERERVANHPANPDSSTLTAAEREAVQRARDSIASTMPYESRRSASDFRALGGLLERLGGER
jgi:hypothetical protein